MGIPTLCNQLEGLSLQKVSLFSEILGCFNERKLTSNLEYKSAMVVAQGICKIFKKAIEEFKNGHLLEFEALVSDAACQNRAIMLAIYTLQKEVLLRDIEPLSERLTLLSQHCAMRACKLADRHHKPVPSISFLELLEQEKIVCEIQSPLLHLGQMYMLKQTKVVREKSYLCLDCQSNIKGYQDQTEENKLGRFFTKVQADLLRELVNYSKKRLSCTAVAFLQKQARLSCDPQVPRMISRDNVKVILEREELPCFYSVKAVMQIALRLNIAVVVRVKKSEHLVEKSPDEPYDVMLFYRAHAGRFVPSPATREDIPAIVIEGMRSGAQLSAESVQSYVQRLIAWDLMELIDLNTAQHPQYTRDGSLHDVPLLQTEEFKSDKTRLLKLASRANQVGAALNNQSLFCISHIFCDRLLSIISETPEQMREKAI